MNLNTIYAELTPGEKAVQNAGGTPQSVRDALTRGTELKPVKPTTVEYHGAVRRLNGLRTSPAQRMTRAEANRIVRAYEGNHGGSKKPLMPTHSLKAQLGAVKTDASLTPLEHSKAVHKAATLSAQVEAEATKGRNRQRDLDRAKQSGARRAFNSQVTRAGISTSSAQRAADADADKQEGRTGATRGGRSDASIVAQYCQLEDPSERRAFYLKNRAALLRVASTNHKTGR